MNTNPDIQKTKFFQFLLLASSLAQKLKKFCFLDVWVGIHLVVSGYRVVIICILSKTGQKPPKFAHLWRLNRLAQKKAIYSFGCVQTSRFSTNFDLGKVFINGGESTQKPEKWQFSPKFEIYITRKWQPQKVKLNFIGIMGSNGDILGGHPKIFF